MSELVTRSAAELARLVRDGEVSAREVVDAHLDRIAAVDGDAGHDADAVGERDVHAFATDGIPVPSGAVTLSMGVVIDT